MEFEFDLPEITEGYFKITNFPYWFKHSNNEIYTKIEFAHVIKQFEKGFNIEKIQSYYYREFNLENLMFFKLDDIFNSKSKRIQKKKKDYQLKVSLKCYDNSTFITSNDHLFMFASPESADTKYYQVIADFKKSAPVTVIIPSVVVAQAFFLVNSLIIKNIFRVDFQELENLVQWENKIIDNLIVGEVSLRGKSSNNIKSMAKSLAFYLFSQDDYLFKNLVKMQSHLYDRLLNTPGRNPYTFLIPIRDKLVLTINGSYHTYDDKTFFIANEIVKADNEAGFTDLYTVDFIKFIDYSYQQSLENEPSGNNGRVIKQGNNKDKLTSTNEDVNKDLMDHFLESGKDILGDIVKLSIDHKIKNKLKAGIPISLEKSPYGTFNIKLSDPNSKSGGMAGGKEGATDAEIDKRKIFPMMYSISEKLKLEFKIFEYFTKSNEIIIFKILNQSNHCSILVTDCYTKRIQIVRKATLEEFTDIEIDNLVKRIKDYKYNWRSIKRSKTSDGLLFEQSTNYNLEGTRIEKKNKEGEKAKKEVIISDLCYLNVLKKLRDLTTIEE